MLHYRTEEVVYIRNDYVKKCPKDIVEVHKKKIYL